MLKCSVHLSRIRRQPRHYPGESSAYCLVRWLNEVKDGKARERVISLINAGKEFDRLKRDQGFPRASLPYVTRHPIATEKQLANARQAARLRRGINKLLSRYRTYPVICWQIKPSSQWTVEGIPISKRGKLTIPVFAGGDYGEFRFSEAAAVRSALRLGEQGYLIRLRECPCGRWFYARFVRKRFCGMPCQQQDFRETDKFRAYRREYMRDHRKTLAEMSGRKFKPRPRRANSSRKSQ